MNKHIISLAIACGAIFAPIEAFAAYEQAVQSVVASYVPDHAGYVMPKVTAVTINDQKKSVLVKLSESAAYVPLTVAQVEQMKADVISKLPAKCAKYSVKFMVGKRTLSELAIGAKRPNHGPKETVPFVTRLDAEKAPRGLDGANIALWQSHGWYFEPKLNRWEFQRARVMQTVEDLYTQSFVMPFLMPMLENAGAYVMSPRERDVRVEELIIDNDIPSTGYSESGEWKSTDRPGFYYDGQVLVNGSHPFSQGTARMAKADKDCDNVAAYNAEIPASGNYAVYVSYQSLPNSVEDAIYTVNAANGAHQFKVNQKMGGGTWIYLGHFPFEKGKSQQPLVQLSSSGRDGGNSVITADAVKIGGGYGNVARIVAEPRDGIEFEYVVSNYPRFTEGARYFLQWAGAPDSVFTPTDYVNDYNDDYRCRGLWVNWLAGGSSMVPNQKGLGIPVDLSLAFHTDAGTTLDDSIIGTLGIYCTESKADKYANGSARLAARDLTNQIMTNITEDVRAAYEPNWMRRGMWDKSYAEARVPEVPAMLLELLSHQNFADMKYGLDPSFRFTVSRAIYKGMLKYIAERDGRDYVVQPLPINAFAISGGKDGKYTLQWQPTEDKQEATATPTYYLVQERKHGEVGFRTIAKVDGTSCDVDGSDGQIHSYRVIAGNDGGVSFPSEVLALCYMPGRQQVLVVNGFTRVSAPDWFDSGEIAGFYDMRDHGMPYVQDISFIGSQFEYRRDIPWMDDDAAGFGASRSNYETAVIAGNTFDFVVTHGEAIVDAEHGFISASVDAFCNGYQTDAKMLDLILGKQKEIKVGTGLYGTKYKTFPVTLQQRLSEYTATGGNVFVSGAFIATDLWDNPFSSPEVAERDQKFASSVLGYKWRVGQASVTGQAYEVVSKFKSFGIGEFDFSNELNSECYAVESPDSFYASDSNGATIMRYKENNLVAGIAYSPGKYRTVVIGFPFETIDTADQRAQLMKQILSFFQK